MDSIQYFQYKKPSLLLDMEKEILIILKSVPTETDDYDKSVELLKELMGEGDEGSDE